MPARTRFFALGALLGAGLLVVGIGAVASSTALWSAAGPAPQVGAATVGSGGAGTVPPTIGTGPPDASTANAPSASTSVPSTSASPTSATLPPVAFTGDFATFDKSLVSGLIGHGDLAVSVAVARNGQLVHEAAFGVANQATGEPVTPADRFRIASNSKVLAATIIMQMVQDGTLHLGDHPLPGLAAHLGVTLGAPAMASITIRQLLSHTSGFPEYTRTFFGGGAKSCPDAARRGLTGDLLGPPGTIYRYSNMNFCILGLLIEQVTGQPLQAVVQARLLEPLGIDDMRMAGTYDVRKGDVAHPTTPGRTFMEALGGAGAWLGTAADLVRIVDALDTSRPGWHPLSSATLKQMLTGQPGIPYSNGQWYGLGLRVWADGTWGHTGTVENARSMVIRRPDGITWAVIVSGNAPSNTDRLRARVDAAFATIGVSPPPTTVPAAAPPPAAGAPTTARVTVPGTVGEG